MICSVPYMDLKQIASSGQCFRMEEREPGLYGAAAGGRYVEVRQESESVFAFSCSEEDFKSFWSHYFDLETDYGAIQKRIAPEDGYLLQAAKAGRGIRILNQDLWEMIVTFIISQQNNIPRIRRCIRLLCERYGKAGLNFRGEAVYDFPTAGRLAEAGEEELKACNLGYRAGYIMETARMIADQRFCLEGLKYRSYEDARKELQKLRGVGKKVADCVCLFALHHVDAFPVDTHIAQALNRHYPAGFPFEKYRGIGGVLQQYIFYYELHGSAVC